MTRASLVATADMSLVEDLEYHITPTGLVHIDGIWYTLEQVDPELAELELADSIARYHSLCKRPRSRHAWNAIAARLWNALQGPANLAAMPVGTERRSRVLDLHRGAQQRAGLASRLGRAV